MKIVNKTYKEIIKDQHLNLKFLSIMNKNFDINCKILKDNFYLDTYNYYPICENNYTYSDIFFWGDQSKYNNFYTKEFNKNFQSKKIDFKEINNVIVLGSSSVNNYYRNMLTFLPRIFFLNDKKIKLAIHRNLSNKFRDFIVFLSKKLQIDVQFIFLDDDFYKFTNSQIPQFFNRDISIKILNSLRIKSNLKQKQKIYLKRQNTYYRNIINEQDIIELLKEKDFRIIDLNNLNILDQIKLFSEADTIVSPTSSGLTNLVFCSKEAKIIEISPHYNFDYEKSLKFRYKYICEKLNLTYTNIEADPINSNLGNKITKKIIDAKVLKESNYYKNLLVRIDQLEKIL